LPTIAGAHAGIIVLGDERSIIHRDDVEPLIGFMGTIGTADIRRSPGADISTGSRDANPIGTAGSLRGVLARLICRAIVANKLAFM
jgi:hypothetical protein